ncbi:MAG: DUF2804 domain-containing protein [Propionibacteriaceae bacterium]|jgi:hypothetical protein|nr:DUF2804 domain-containing protein [Propionibacteriaceae bacterium]
MLTAASVVDNGQRHWGRFLRTPSNANPAAAFPGLKGAFESFRTKEWVGFTITHREFFSSMIVQDAKYLLSSEWYLSDIASQSLAQHAANLLAGSVRLPADILHSQVNFAAKGYHIHYGFSEQQVVITIDLAQTKTAPAVHGKILLDAAKAAPPLVVSTRLPKGSMYTNKIIFPASGAISVGNRASVFDPSQDFAILDEHKSHLPYRTTWTWGTFALPVEGGYAGANFAIRPALPGQEEESCIWTPDAAEPLANVHFTQLRDDPRSDWSIESTDGRLDVLFSPLGHKGVDQQLVLAEIHYLQMYGQYSGILRGENGTWEFKEVHGVCEKMDMRA